MAIFVPTIVKRPLKIIAMHKNESHFIFSGKTRKRTTFKPAMSITNVTIIIRFRKAVLSSL